MLLDRVAAVQVLVVGVLFAWAGAWKVFAPSARALAARSALANMVGGPQRALVAHLAVGIGELVVAALLLLPPARPWAMWFATVFALGFVGYLALAYRIAPDKPCGCMGGNVTKISRRSVARAVALVAMTLLGWPAHTYWLAALAGAPWLLLLVAVEAFVLWLLSPEFGWAGVRFERRLTRLVQQRVDPVCARVVLDWSELESRLIRTVTYRELFKVVEIRGTSDHWREDCSGYVAYESVYDGQPATTVFSFPVRFDSRDVAAAVVSAQDETIFLQLASPRQSASMAGNRAANQPASALPAAH